MRGRLVLTVTTAVAAIAITWVLGAPDLGADTDTYAAGARSLYETGNPYAVNASRFFEQHYRYPPLLAMVWPAIGWAWYGLCALGWLTAIGVRFRISGTAGLLLPLLFSGIIIGTLLVGNAAALVVGAVALVPVTRRAGATAAAVATWIKLFPAVVVIWYVARRDWQSLRWYLGTVVFLGFVQAPWIQEWVNYSTSELSRYPSPGLSLLQFGPVVWIAGTLALAVVTFRTRRWMWAVLTMLAASPRLLLPSYVLLISDPWLFALIEADDRESVRAPGVRGEALDPLDLEQDQRMKHGD